MSHTFFCNPVTPVTETRSMTDAFAPACDLDGYKKTDSLIAADGSLVGHYAYGPFGPIIATTGSLAVANSYRISSEFEEGKCVTNADFDVEIDREDKDEKEWDVE